MKVDYANFTKRKDRQQYITDNFSHLLRGRVLDVGCDQGSLRELLDPTVDYTGIDVGGNPDILVNLEEVSRLPFEDNSFDCVLCADVLEHLDNFHHSFEELLRVSERYVIISLPNCWVNARRPIERGRGGFSHYGLPTEKPMDRHKWFFSMSEIVTFMQAQESRLPFKIRDLHVTEKPRDLLIKLLRRVRHPKQSQYLNRYCHTVWTVLEKETATVGLA